MNRGIVYKFFKFFEFYQYSVANVIGVQTQANISYFDHWTRKHRIQIEVLHNWPARAPNIGSSFNVSKSKLAGRFIFVYAGNMGIAQGMEILINLAESLIKRSDIGFLFIGRGSNADQLSKETHNKNLDNVLFQDEIPSKEIPGLFSQCHAGLIALDQRHKTHNVPGKFLSYMQSGLPVLATINQGNDLGDLIKNSDVGRVCMEHSVEKLKKLAEELADEFTEGKSYIEKCNALSEKLFSTETATKQIISALNI